MEMIVFLWNHALGSEGVTQNAVKKSLKKGLFPPVFGHLFTLHLVRESWKESVFCFGQYSAWYSLLDELNLFL